VGGTGTAGELLSVAAPFLEREIHPTVIIGAFHRALDDGLRMMEAMATRVDTNNRAELLAIVRSSLGTKLGRSGAAHIAAPLGGWEYTHTACIADTDPCTHTHTHTHALCCGHSRWSDLMCGLALDAVLTVSTESDGRREVDIKRYARVEKVSPHTYTQTHT
jgi:T-complex protein 1 subunit gamma